MILTDSRAGAVALAVVLVACILLDKRNRVQAVVFIAVLGLLIGYRVSDRYITRLADITKYTEDESSMGRVATNQAAINMIKAHPVFGVGAGNFNYVFLSYTPGNLQKWVRPGKSIHNVFLQITSETGLVGLLLFSLFLTKSFIDVIRIAKGRLRHESSEPLTYMAIALGVALFGYLVNLQFTPGAYYSSIYIFTPLIAAAKGIYQQCEKESVEPEESYQEHRILIPG